MDWTHKKRSVARNCRDQISATHATISPPVYTKKYSRAGKVAGLYFISFFSKRDTKCGKSMRDVFFSGSGGWLQRKQRYVWEKKGGKSRQNFLLAAIRVFLRGQFFIFPPPAGNRSECLREKLIDEDMWTTTKGKKCVALATKPAASESRGQLFVRSPASFANVLYCSMTKFSNKKKWNDCPGFMQQNPKVFFTRTYTYT